MCEKCQRVVVQLDAKKILDEYKKYGVLEDRREYDAEDIMSSLPGTSKEVAEEVEKELQSGLYSDRVIRLEREWSIADAIEFCNWYQEREEVDDFLRQLFDELMKDEGVSEQVK